MQVEKNCLGSGNMGLFTLKANLSQKFFVILETKHTLHSSAALLVIIVTKEMCLA